MKALDISSVMARVAPVAPDLLKAPILISVATVIKSAVDCKYLNHTENLKRATFLGNHQAYYYQMFQKLC